MSIRPGRSLIVAAVLTVVSACSAGGSTSSAPGSPTQTEVTAASSRPTTRPDPLVRPVIDGSFEVEEGRSLYLQCWGEGSPTIVVDAGGGEIQEYREYAATFTSRIASQRRICAYDRAGHGRSDPAPNKPRQLEDVAGDLHALLDAAGVDGPKVLVGNSFGGFIMAFYANHYPDEISGVALIDVPRPSGSMTEEDEPELAWDHPENTEHMDVVAGFENRLSEERFPFDSPLLVITATEGQSDVDDQAFWLDWSQTSRQIEVNGGHDLHAENPVPVADAILDLGS